jgi:hypothetical protein
MINAGKTLVMQPVLPIGSFPANTVAVRLPANIDYPAGQVLGIVNTVKRNEVHRITLGNGSGGTWLLIYPDGTTISLAHNANAASIQAAINTVLGAAAVSVSGTGPVDITYSGAEYANRELSLPTLVSSLTGGTQHTIALQTRGAAGGTNQAAAYNAGVNDGRDAARLVLQKGVKTNFNGAVVNEFGPGDLYSVTAYDSGDFFGADLIGLDGTNVSQLGRLIKGSAFNSSGSVVRVGA